jgi:hypothetical protein
MAKTWKQPGRNTIDLKKKEVGTRLEGTYTGYKDITTELGVNRIWEFHDEEGKPYGVYGFTSLNYQMERVAPGTNCRLTYQGKGKTKSKFGNFPHKVMVECESDDAEEVGEDPMDEPTPE